MSASFEPPGAMMTYKNNNKYKGTAHMLRELINSQTWLSRKFDKLLPNKYTLDGNYDYVRTFVPQYLKKNLKIYDIGGGKRPFLSVEKKHEINATVVGIDIDGNELKKAPKGAYDEVVVSDISKCNDSNKADLLICQAVLEHVKDVESAFKAISGILKPGGTALIFVPSRNAIFARLNIILPETLKKKLLFTIFPIASERQGFPSYYNKCTPNDFKKLASLNNLAVTEERYYFISSYFSFFFPAYLIWRLWILLFHFFCGNQAAETFSFALRKDNA